ncbi:MAG: hypothetical protein ACK41C_20625 [Phenylobacterium sp.]|uniref:hypothetical protein n=1 Tax=Phenylobacterium sp. TaxID=1871053 RepID=UPI00391D2FC2
MTGADRRRWTLLTASLLLHAAVLGALALRSPLLQAPAAPETTIEVTVVPRFIPPERTDIPTRASPARPLNVRRLRELDEASPVAPLYAPESRGSGGGGAGTSISPAPLPAWQDQLRQALRRGAVGCANAEAVRLTKAERDACDETFGAGAKDAPFIEPPMAPDKRRAFDAAAARKEAYQEYKRGNLPIGTDHRDSGPEMRELPPIWPPPR